MRFYLRNLPGKRKEGDLKFLFPLPWERARSKLKFAQKKRGEGESQFELVLNYII